MDTLLLGRRVAQAREDAGMTQEDLGRAVNLDRSAISRLEKGERKLNVPELVEIAAVVGRPLAYFVSDPVPAVVSRRSDATHAHVTTRQLDGALDQFAMDTRMLLERGLLPAVERWTTRVPRNHREAEQTAAAVRDRASLGKGPITDLARACERLALYTFAASLGEEGPDGGCVEVEHDGAAVGAVVVNGDAPPGRRRMTLGHELGHWLFGDAYDCEASLDSERMINSFAIHFLAPRSGVTATWSQHPTWPLRDRALAVAATFQLSWSATISQLRNLGVVSWDDHRALSEQEPRSGDYRRLELSWLEELSPPYLSPGFAAAVLNAYANGRMTAARSLELLRGTLVEEDLPQLEELSLDDLRRSFAGHDG